MKIESNCYKKSGVNIDLAHDLLARVKSKIRMTHRAEVLDSEGGFGGLFQLDLSGTKEPVLVTSVDGVGTKLMVALLMNEHKSIGFDLVNHCINDIACQGAEPLYFMDYLGIGKLRSPLYEEILSGLGEACLAQNVALLGGETAEMPGMYGNQYDLVGSITGVVEKSKVITGKNIKVGDSIIGLASNGLHTNGYSLARKILFDQSNLTHEMVLNDVDGTIGQALLKSHICYWPSIKCGINNELPLHGIAHITGGGLYDNIGRILPKNMDAQIFPDSLNRPEIFNLIQSKGDVPDREMYKVFNMGIGLVWILPSTHQDTGISICQNLGFQARSVGKIVSGNRVVKIKGVDF